LSRGGTTSKYLYRIKLPQQKNSTLFQTPLITILRTKGLFNYSRIPSVERKIKKCEGPWGIFFSLKQFYLGANLRKVFADV
jgi:hypothetical protein